MKSVVEKSQFCSEKNTSCPLLRVGIVGASGYTGLLLLHLLKGHPQVELVCVTARQYAGQLVASIFPSVYDQQLRFVDVDQDLSPLMVCQLVFLATPHGVGMAMVPALLAAGIKVIDLSADFRLQDPAVWLSWYHQPHTAPTYLSEAAYGLTEHYRQQIAAARLIANPGCYPTAIQLALWPLLKHQLIDPAGLVMDAKSGVSGAGRQAKTNLLASEVMGSFKAYGAEGHRHTPEIFQGLQAMLPLEARAELSMTFLPHLLPTVRGIEASIYVRPKASYDACLQALQEAYQDEYFVQVVDGMPDSKSVQGTNFCQIGIAKPKESPHLVLSSVIDNLMKGAAGQAIQNMNVMNGWEETLGLRHLLPAVP
jgi:N-acetyl-gamma-glutamyl-phosphate reductase